MASEEHKQLADYIKNVHQMLRMNARKVGASQAWEDHCQQEETLKRYAEVMHQLATDHWDNNFDKRVYSRIQWIVEQSLKYFLKGGHDKEKCKEMKKIQNQGDHNVPCENCAKFSDQATSSVFTLLDVGSCYNPFKKYHFFKVLPIDLKPACSDVFEADFLSLLVSSDNMATEDITKVLPIKYIPENHFDVVIFSLLLEYMPSSQQRFICCEKAYHILRPGGLLFIISPDSKHATANSSLMKKWRICLALIGFTRIVYEKLPHIHCMAFRKNLHPVVSQQWAQRAMTQELTSSKETWSSEYKHELLKIPQDDTDYFIPDAVGQPARTDADDRVIVNMFEELPQDIHLS